jgi:hypothetical protein
VDISDIKIDPFKEKVDYKQQWDDFVNKKGDQFANFAVDTYLNSPLIWKATAYNKNVPATIRFASKSLLGDTRPITEKDMTEAELEALSEAIQRSSDRLSPGGLAEKTNKWANSLLNSKYKAQANKNYQGDFDEFENKEVYNRPMIMPEIIALNNLAGKKGLTPLDYASTPNEAIEYYAGNIDESLGSILKKVFTDKLYDTRHAIASADYKYDPKTKTLNVKDTYDFLPLGEYETNKIYKKIHDTVRTKGSTYPVNINLSR